MKDIIAGAALLVLCAPPVPASAQPRCGASSWRPARTRRPDRPVALRRVGRRAFTRPHRSGGVDPANAIVLKSQGADLVQGWIW